MRRTPPGSHEAREPDVERTISASEVTDSHVSYADLERIRESSVRQNKPEGVHAALLCQSGWYLHWIEGPSEAVRATMHRVQADTRHHGHRLVHHSLGQRYLQTRWSMMLNASEEPPAAFGARVEALHAARRRGIEYPPTSVIRRLSAPMRLGGGDAEDPELFHRVGVCSADDGRSFDFVRHLAERHGGQRQIRRVAGEADLDSGSDYVDLLEQEAPCRVIVVSRAGLQHGLLRSFLPDWSHLVLLFGPDARRNTLLIERVLAACERLPQTPVLLGATSEAPVHAHMIGAARDAGLEYHQLGDMRANQHKEIWAAIGERLRHVGMPPSSQWDQPQPV